MAIAENSYPPKWKLMFANFRPKITLDQRFQRAFAFKPKQPSQDERAKRSPLLPSSLAPPGQAVGFSIATLSQGNSK